MNVSKVPRTNVIYGLKLSEESAHFSVLAPRPEKTAPLINYLINIQVTYKGIEYFVCFSSDLILTLPISMAEIYAFKSSPILLVIDLLETIEYNIFSKPVDNLPCSKM